MEFFTLNRPVVAVCATSTPNGASRVWQRRVQRVTPQVRQARRRRLGCRSRSYPNPRRASDLGRRSVVFRTKSGGIGCAASGYLGGVAKSEPEKCGPLVPLSGGVRPRTAITPPSLSFPSFLGCCGEAHCPAARLAGAATASHGRVCLCCCSLFLGGGGGGGAGIRLRRDHKMGNRLDSELDGSKAGARR